MAGVFHLGDAFFYHPNDYVYESPRGYALDYESVSFRTDDDTRLHGWFFPAQIDPVGTVLHLHGNAGNITGHFQHVAWLPAAGWNVLCFDYRGYGQSEGRVTRAGTINDAHAALDYLLNRPDVNSDRIVAFGQSLGGAIGIVLTAERTEIRGLATDGAFDGYRRIAWWHVIHSPLLLIVGWWVPWLLMGKGHDPVDYVAGIAPRPVLIMHGTADRIAPPRMAQHLYAAAADPKELWLIDGAGHYEAMQDRTDQAHPRLLAFFNRCLASGSPLSQSERV